MPRWTERLLVGGHGGTGRTTTVRSWADDAIRNVDGPVVWIRGAFEQYADPTSASSANATTDAVTTVASAGAVAVDDAHWLSDEVIEALVARSADVPMCATLASWPDSAALQHLASALTLRAPGLRLEPMTSQEIADIRDEDSTTEITAEAIALFTAGSPALTRLCLEHRWPGDSDQVPAAVADAVIRLARQSGHDVVQLLQLMSLGLRLEDAVAAVRPVRDDVERRLRVSGLVSNGAPLRVAVAAFRHDMTRSDRQTLGALIGESGIAPSADVRAQIDRTSTDHLRQAAAAFRLGDPDAERLVSRATADPADNDSAATAAALQFGIDMRSMRWTQAAADAPTVPLGALAGAFAADLSDRAGAEPSRSVIDHTQAMIVSYADGSPDSAMALGADITERAQTLDFDETIGWSPAAISSLVALGSGDARTARAWVVAALATNASGDGEQRSHRLIAAMAGIALNEFSEALDLVREGADHSWPRRDRLLLAAIDAAIARRSGDTARLRSAWQQCEPLIVGQPVSWLLFDPLLEVLCAGARVGDTRRVGPLADQLTAQLQRLPTTGPGGAAALWLSLQLAISADEWATVTDVSHQLGQLPDADRRSSARSAAGRGWAGIAAARATGASIDLGVVDDAVSKLVAVDDAWEASRLLGQAALDHADAGVARSLLERARQLVTDPVETADALLAAGLSEREADVARLVAEGRTYKDIGAQLFISAKTVEHHVAKVRQRLGAGSRAEMLATIREMS